MRLVLLLSLAIFSCLSKAEIYTAKSDSGVEKWSTQALDTSYTKTSIIENQPIEVAKPLHQNPLKAKAIATRSKTSNAALASIQKAIADTSNKYKVDPELVEALIAIESSFNTNAISPKGARGLMQLMPATAMRYGMKNVQELHIPTKNIDIGVRHLKDLLELHRGQVSLAIASYNAGQGAVAKHGQRIPQYRETMIYVPAVLAYMARSAGAGHDVRHD